MNADIDPIRLRDFLKQEGLDLGAGASLQRIKGGQSNPTYRITGASGDFILRKKPSGDILPSAHAVEREYRILDALAPTPVPVPEVHLLCEDSAVIGTPFYVMEYLEGRVFWDHSLEEIGDPQERSAMYQEMSRVLAAIHTVDVEAIGLGDWVRSGSYYERQFKRWEKQYRASETGTIEAMEELIAWLQPRVGEQTESISLLHGDYRLDNLMFHPKEPRVIGVLDWELSTVGDPISDLAYQIMPWHWDFEGPFRGLGGLDRKRWGLPGDDEYRDDYLRRTGFSAAGNWNFYLAFCIFRLAAILQGVRKRAEQGIASGDDAAARGALVAPLAEYGVTLLT